MKKQYWRLKPWDEDLFWNDPAWKQILAHLVARIVEEFDHWTMHKTGLDRWWPHCFLHRWPLKHLWHWATDHDPWQCLGEDE